MNKKSLLLGNGINRVLSDKYSSFSLLEEICKGVINDFDNIDKMSISFQLIFESIFYEFEKKGKGKELMKKIEGCLKQLNKLPNDLLLILKDKIGIFDSIITTNYDYAIEFNCFNDTRIKTAAISRNQGYSYKDLVYHIHGDFGKNHSICFGRINYQKFFKSCTSHIKNNLLDYNTLEELCNALPIHLQKFLTNDIDIVGLDLDSSELIVWYMLTLRAFIINCKKDIKISNAIRYHHALQLEENENKEDAVKLQESIRNFYKKMNVIYDYHIINYHKSKDYSDEYKKYYRRVLGSL